MEIRTYNTISELVSIGDAWNRLSEREPRFVPSFSELRYELQASGCKFRVLAAIDKFQVIGIACFVYRNATKFYGISEMNLFRLSIKEVFLFGSCVLGQVDECIIEMFLRLIINDSDFDLLDLGFLIIDSPLYNVVTNLRGGVIVGRPRRNVEIQWLIKLPQTFEDYIRSLGSRTRRNEVREFKKLERQPAFEVHVIYRLDQIDNFLQDAEKISRLTYQWNYGPSARFCNDAATRERLVRFAKNEKLRCYIAYFDGHPCAFVYGEWNHRIYIGRIIGYDPKYAKGSPGTALTFWIIRDLIDNTECEFYDFGVGGYFEYKTRLGNTSLNCTRLQVGHLYRPYSFCLVALDKMLRSAKNLLSLVIGQDKLAHRARRLRRYG